MKKLFNLLVFLALAIPAFGQTQTTITGNVHDVTGVNATSGYVEFRLQPVSNGVIYRIAGVTLLNPTTSRCSINSSGNVAGLLGGACSVWGNPAVAPANTCYQVAIYPGTASKATVLPLQLISGGSYDLSSPASCPSLNIQPQDVMAAVPAFRANIVPAVDKMFTLGSASLYYASAYIDQAFINSLNAPTTSMSVRNINNVRYCDQFPGADAAAKIAACFADLPSTGGTANACGIAGAQTFSANAWAAVPNTKPIKLITCADATFTSSVRQDINCSHCIWDMGGAEVIYTGNDRAINAGTPNASILGPYTTNGALIAVGATSFTTSASIGASAGDWLLMVEIEPNTPGVPDAAVFDWAQVSSNPGTTVNLYSPMRTSFPGTHSVPIVYRIPQASLVHDVTVMNGRCTTTNAVDVTPCMTAIHAMNVSYINNVISDAMGQPLYTYRSKGVVWQNNHVIKMQTGLEIPETVDVVVAGNTFGGFGQVPADVMMRVQLGTGFFSITGNVFQNPNAAALYLLEGVHDGVVSNNIIGYLTAVGNPIFARGAQNIAVSNNYFNGGPAGSIGITFVSQTGMVSNIVSNNNLIGPNVMTGLTTYYGTPLSGDTYIKTTDGTNGLQVEVGARNSGVSGLFTCCSLDDDGVTLSWNGSTDTSYVGYNYKNKDGSESVNAAGRDSWRIHMDNAPGASSSWCVDNRQAGAGAGTFTSFLCAHGANGFVGVGANAATPGSALSVSGTSVAYNAAGNNGMVQVTDSANTNKRLYMGLDNSLGSLSATGYIECAVNGTGKCPLSLNLAGGVTAVDSVSGIEFGSVVAGAKPQIISGAGAPGATCGVNFALGSIYLRTNGAVGSTLYYCGGAAANAWTPL